MADEGRRSIRQEVLRAEERERARIAQEIHDGPAQGLANAVFRVDLVARHLDSDPAGARAELDELRSYLNRQLDELRGFLSQLRPSLLDERGLDRALAEAAAHLAASGRTHVEVELAAPAVRLSPDEQVVVLRVAQESLRNIAKHGHAGRAWLETRLGSDDEAADPTWVLEVRDDGVGFEGPRPPEPDHHFGIRFMRDRARSVGADLEVDGATDGGVCVRLTMHPILRR
ncbi:MAG TPA: histidine kinase [Candidatus Limnocylindrales bacterium]|nr:histidine kinase [Candidatus Limnocylindrales bacterium]